MCVLVSYGRGGVDSWPFSRSNKLQSDTRSSRSKRRVFGSEVLSWQSFLPDIQQWLLWTSVSSGCHSELYKHSQRNQIESRIFKMFPRKAKWVANCFCLILHLLNPGLRSVSIWEWRMTLWNVLCLSSFCLVNIGGYSILTRGCEMFSYTTRPFDVLIHYICWRLREVATLAIAPQPCLMRENKTWHKSSNLHVAADIKLDVWVTPVLSPVPSLNQRRQLDVMRHDVIRHTSDVRRTLQ